MAFTFTVEDGTGLATANSFATVAQFKDHHDGRGRDYSAYADTAIQAALVKATDYVEKRWGNRWRGDRGSRSQALGWPRTSAFTDEDYLISGVPAELVKAVVEYAWLSLTLGTELAPVPQPVAGKITRETVGPITTEYGAGTVPMTSTGAMTQNLPDYPEADLWVANLISGGISRMLSRG